MHPIPLWTDHWDAIVAKFIDRPRLLIACDFDGTLTPIMARPEEAVLRMEVRGLLRKLRTLPGVTVAVVSGRAVADLRLRVGIDGVLYSGNDGLEIDAPGILWSSAEARAHRHALGQALAELRYQIGGIPGVIIEDKQLSATVHWRLAEAERLESLRSMVEAIVANQPGLQLMEGKAAWELRPKVEWNKGSAVESFLSRLNLAATDAIYMGDDDTDEPGFRVVRDGLSLRVGDASGSAARYRLGDQEAAIAFLFCLFAARVAARRTPRTAMRRSELAASLPSPFPLNPLLQ